MEKQTIKNYISIEKEILIQNIAGLIANQGTNQIDRVSNYIDFAYDLQIITYDEMNVLRKRVHQLAFKEKSHSYAYIKRMLFNTIEYIEY